MPSAESREDSFNSIAIKMPTSTQLDQELFRILLYRNDATEILLETTPEGFRLPILSVPAQRREAEEITNAIRTSWNLDAYALFCLPASAPAPPFVHDYVLELRREDTCRPHRMEWLPVDNASLNAFRNSLDSGQIRKSLELLRQYRREDVAGPFGKPGWLRTVSQWVETQAAANGLCLTSSIRQLNASPTFSLLRFETDGPALWFKAVGEPNLREYSLTAKLASMFPEFLPRLLALEPAWHAWLSVEAEGTHLNENSPLSRWQQALGTFARLQRGTYGNALHLIAAGAQDARAVTLQSYVQPFFDFVACLMDEQIKSRPQPLSRPEIRILKADVMESLERLEASGIRNVLLHMDFNLNNIVVGKTDCVFLDWAEGAVGNSFLTFEYAREHWRKLHGSDPIGEKALLSAYRKEWQSFVSYEAIEAASAQAPLVAAYASVALHKPWQEPASTRAIFAPYLRSITRRMNREAKTLKQRRTVCFR